MTANPLSPDRESVLPVAPSRGRLRPLGIGDVRITGGFWEARQQTNATAILDHCLTWMHRVGWIDNFRAATEGRLPDDRRGREFSDSDVYKLIEAMAWEHGRSGDSWLDTTIRELTAIIAPTQEGDGYLNTAFGRPGQPARYSDLEWGHELYCYGHLIQAGVARARTCGDDDEFVQVARRAADHVCDTFGPHGIEGICGHPEIEMALVELARHTGDQRYLDQAALFVERRGRGTLADIEFGRKYYQDDVPVSEADVFRGHAVRALYLASGAVDVAVETGDADLLDAVVRQWEVTVARRTYITGGMGSQHMDEAFGDDFVLPPDRAYSETCAGVASVMLSWRLLLATGQSRFADLAERTLYNVVATSPAADGRSFFYANTLHQRHRGTVPSTDTDSPRAASSLRAPWFAVSCCLPNVARTLAGLATYLVTADPTGLQIHQYADASVSTRLDDGTSVGFEMTTDYPHDGTVTVRIAESPDAPWTLSLRVPSWASNATVVEPGGARRGAAAGTVEIRRTFSPGDQIRLELPVQPRWVSPDPRVDAVRGTVAVERGPVVMCVESPDLPVGHDVDSVRVDPSVAPVEADGSVAVAGELHTGADRPWPYGAPAVDDRLPARIPLIPYHAWAERGPSTMRVWLPTTSTAGGPNDEQP